LLQRRPKIENNFAASLFDVCEWFVLEKHGFMYTKLKKPDEENETLRIVKAKLADIKPLTKKEKQRLFDANSDMALSRYEWLVNNFDFREPEKFYTDICELGTYLSRHDVMGRKIFMQAHRFLAGYDAAAYSLMCYLQYLNVKTPTPNFRHRSVAKELRPKLFRNKQQEKRFLDICDQLKRDKNPDRAIESARVLFRLSRRKIELNIPEIEDVSRKFEETSGLLGKYLDEEAEPDTGEIFSVPVILLSDHRNKLIKLFESNNFVLNKKEINTFAQKEGVFSESLIQQINETCYDELDDLLIEEAGDIYTLNSHYLKKLANEFEY
jgi:hypothetical protein